MSLWPIFLIFLELILLFEICQVCRFGDIKGKSKIGAARIFKILDLFFQ